MSSLQCIAIEPRRGRLRPYLLVTKPGIVLGNMVSIVGAFFLASRGSVDLALLLATLLGVSLVVASACVFNNVIDRDIDGKMQRTRNRALVRGLISPLAALVYASALGLLGGALLLAKTNLLAVAVALAGMVIYLGAYSLYLKRHSVHATLIGSLSGAAPPLAAYCAVRNQLDLEALLLLLMFSLWQMPHAYAIAIFRLRDYRAASIPVLPVKRGVALTKRHMLAYILAFTTAALMLTVCGYTGIAYFALALALGAYWVGSVRFEKSTDDQTWARKQFVFSILIITALSVTMALDFVAPLHNGS
jgi:protoheme IX farnesyltransferase